MIALVWMRPSSGSTMGIARRGRAVALVALVVSSLGAPARAEDPTGTFSIVARDPETGELGVAVQSRAFSVGGGVPWAEAGVGAIATQSRTNESFGPRGLAMMRSGIGAPDALSMLLAHDDAPEERQVGIIDAAGRVAAHTGEGCGAWAGDSMAVDVSVQGNILAGSDVVRDMLVAFQSTEGDLAERLLAALEAGQGAGGDRRGQQSAALLVVRESDTYPEYRTRYVDLRVEDHPTPIAELRRVFRIHQASDLLRAHMRYAEAYEAAGDTASAARERARVGSALTAALADDDASATTLNALAWYCAINDVHLDEALRAAARAVELAPDDAAILDTLAEVYYRRGDPVSALEVIGRACALEPDDAYYAGQRARFAEGR